jgi:catechol 2,3-dioxygenase-like lactoylglutathione lyase family enzyme
MTSNSADQPPYPQEKAQQAAQDAGASIPTHSGHGYILNHVAIKVASVSASKAFYADLLDMREIFKVETGRFTAHYLGSPLAKGESGEDMLPTLGTRSALLELISVQEDTHSNPTGSGDIAGQKNKPRFHNAHGFVHLGFRVPDVAETLRRARERGWAILKDVNNLEIAQDLLPGRTNETQQPAKWCTDFEPVLAQIGFVADPDG